MKFNWLPWKYLIRAAAHSHGFIDPIRLLSQLSKFSQPSEVAEPIELLRAGVIFHARGLINSRVIQHNLDWVWPYWIERQFDPSDISFIPRAFSLTHVNLTHRNWTAVGIPGYGELPLVDPRGLLTPFIDKWSLDTWILKDSGEMLLPSRMRSASQRYDFSAGLKVVTNFHENGVKLATEVEATLSNDLPVCQFDIHAEADSSGWLIISLRPCNTEGVTFINEIELTDDRKTWVVDSSSRVHFSESIDQHYASTFNQGDVYIHLHDTVENSRKRCNVGLLTAAAMFRLDSDSPRNLNIQIPLDKPQSKENRPDPNAPLHSWGHCLQKKCQLSVPDNKISYLYECSLRTLVLCSPDDTFPGPYTYKRFWFRDAAFITCGLLYAGLIDRAERSLRHFPGRQTRKGYFHSQEGEWDSNGEVLWILQRFYECTTRLPDGFDWWPSIRKGADWIIDKRLSQDTDSLHAGLMPAGFSAEHLGPIDYYYWDDYWSIAGLRAASKFADVFQHTQDKSRFEQQAGALRVSVDESLKKISGKIPNSAIPASPYRRMDAGAIGSLAAGYPLQIYQPGDQKLLDTAGFLIDNCFVDNGFFQDMIHSGINPYLTLHVAQVLLRAGDMRFFDLLTRVAELASPTGQWPEAVHSHTLGGCMGDGQHAWAAAEWIIMLRNCFVREEADCLILGSGIPRQWLATEEPLYFGPAPTSFGHITINIKQTANVVTVSWDAAWHQAPASTVIKLPGLDSVTCTDSRSSVAIELPENA